MVDGPSFRKELRARVRPLWTEKGFEIQEALKEKARTLIKEDYAVCATKPANEYAACLRNVAMKKGLAKVFREVWGTT